MNYAGIDVSKHHLDLFTDSLSRVPNTDAGYQHLASLVPSGCIVVMESTGGYERACANHLRAAGFGVCVVNPAEVAAFRRSQGRRAKTDFIDAQVLAAFGEARKLTADAGPMNTTLQAAISRMEQLRRMIIAEKNRLEHSKDFERESVQRILESLKAETMRCREHVRRLIAESRSLQAKVDLLTDIKGIGETVATTLVAALPELGRLGNKQIASLAGLAPHPHDSGNFKGKRRIAGGRAQVRSMLYLAAMTAARYPGIIREMYRRLREAGKPAKVALVACARRLLTVANARIRELMSQEGGRRVALDYA